jgi:hypothetical protein
MTELGDIVAQHIVRGPITLQRGWMVVAEYADNSISASDRRKVRPGYVRTSGLIQPGR